MSGGERRAAERPRLCTTALIAALLAGTLGSCNELRSDWAREEAERIARPGRLSAHRIDAGKFILASYQRVSPGRGDTLVVYIEGDGLAWLNRAHPSDDPTPADPVALRLAAADDAPAVLYLARPCQYVTGAEARNCEPKYWTTARFAVEVVDAADRAVDLVKAAVGKSKVELIGYSGGGVLATLLAARRGDVVRVITVAANLDLGFWTAYHDVTPLFESLKPTDFVDTLGRVPQVMLVGGRDEVVPPSVISHYRETLPVSAPVAVISITDFSHSCCWAEAWPKLVREARALP